MNDTIRLIQNHRSIRNYLDKDIPEEVLDEILKASQSMPNSINGQQISVIVVKDKKRKSEISAASGSNPWIDQAPVFLIFVADFYKTNIAALKSGKKQVIQESVEGTLAATFDAGLAMGGAIVAAESLGLGIVPIGGVRTNPEEIIRLLELPEYTFPLAGLVIGYPADNSALKPRLPLESFAHEETYNKEKVKEAIDTYDKAMEEYYTKRGDKSTNWSNQVSSIYQFVYFPKVYPTMKKQGFLNDK
ncbi:NADPH-dependent oxidoreductase [Clostridium sp. 19966]|uniref:NADPH-dependent oxidoreductase n=1 Tax=Clostridium sp. 19966 TaxID=2768166 RepID=UPI0028DE52A4|nr:NADPH-dependent oxidoreductase [Clostridium sp. 19966]MDT8715680.1 NADPH-dependent oxidoreductase [Clostridium sp. 19966]